MTPLPFELHPEIPVEGLSLRDRWGPRYERALAMYDRIAAECAEVGLPFRRPEQVPNTRRALEIASWVRMNEPHAFPALDLLLFRAHFVDGIDLGDRDALDGLVASTGADAAAAADAFADGTTHDIVTASMQQAYDLGIAATPTWLIAGMIVPGVQPREVYERVVRRAQNRA